MKFHRSRLDKVAQRIKPPDDPNSGKAFLEWMNDYFERVHYMPENFFPSPDPDQSSTEKCQAMIENDIKWIEAGCPLASIEERRRRFPNDFNSDGSPRISMEQIQQQWPNYFGPRPQAQGAK
jgi:hypothetical protein